MAPQISVVIPYCNNRGTLAEAVTSVLNQTFTDWELLLVNDGSTDGSEELARQFADARIRHLGWEQNRGKSSARNAGWDAAKGKYLAFLDADDTSFPQRLQVQFNYLETHPGTHILGCAYLEADTSRYRVFPWNPGYLAACLLFKNLLIQSGVMLRREIPLRYDTAFERYAQDYKLWWDAIAAGFCIVNLRDVLVAHRPGGSSTGWKDRPDIQEQRLQFFLQRLALCGLHPGSSRAAFFLEAFRGRTHMNRQQVQDLKDFSEELLRKASSPGAHPAAAVDSKQLRAVLFYHWMRWISYRETEARWSDLGWAFSRLGFPAFLRFFYWQNALFLEQLR